MLFIALPICAQLERYEPSGIRLLKTNFGTYGYKETGKSDWRFLPRYKYAEPMKYKESCGAFSIDGKKYGIINSSEFVVAEPIFDRPPHDISYGIAIVDSENGQHLVNFDGKQLSPDVYRIFRHESTFAVKKTETDDWQFVDANFEPLSPEKYKYIKVKKIRSDSITTEYAEVSSDKASYLICDFFGNRLISHGYREITSLYDVVNRDSKILKEVEKSGVKTTNLYPFAFVRTADDTFGIIDYQTDSLIQLKGNRERDALKNLKKIFKKEIAQLCTDDKKLSFNEYLKRINQLTDSLTNANVAALGGMGYFDCIWTRKIAYKEIAEVSTSQNRKSKTQQTKSKTKTKSKTTKKSQKLYKLVDFLEDKDIDTRVFTDLKSIGIIYVGTEKGTKGVCAYDFQGFKLCDGKSFQDIETWTWVDNAPWLMFKENNKWGIMTITGEVKLEAMYDKISRSSNGDITAAYSNGKIYLINGNNGNLINNIAYDSDQFIGYKDYASVKRNGYNLKVYLDGHEDPSVAKISFNEFMDYLNDNPNTMTNSELIEKYNQIINLCSIGDNWTAGACYNNIGVIYHNAGDIATAKSYYSKAMSYGNTVSQSNLAGIQAKEDEEKRQRRSERISAALNGFGNMLSSLGGGSGSNYNANQGSNYGSSNYNSNNGGSANASTYQSIYNRWESKAKSAYEGLTRAGTRTSQNGKATSGTSGGYWNSQNYVALKKDLRNAQNEMRKTRQEARQKGINIVQSNYETVSVSY
jgi:hypothetical protein